MKVLIADDEKELEKYFSATLKRRGIDDISFAFTPEDSVAQIKLLQPDVVVLDVNFQVEDFDGFEVLRQARPLSPQTKFIMSSAYSQHDERFKVEGISAVLSKPLSVQVMVDKIKEVMGVK
ncbi:MAG: response regulator [Candidatus Omnitrophota bacterium]